MGYLMESDECFKPISELSHESLEYLASYSYEVALPQYKKAELAHICSEVVIPYTGTRKSDMIDGILEYRKQRGIT